MVENKVYIVSWQDHFSDSKWMDTDELEDFVQGELGTCTTVGYKTYEDERWVVISGSFDGEGAYGENIAIHKAVIVSMTPLN